MKWYDWFLYFMVIYCLVIVCVNVIDIVSIFVVVNWKKKILDLKIYLLDIVIGKILGKIEEEWNCCVWVNCGIY